MLVSGRVCTDRASVNMCAWVTSDGGIWNENNDNMMKMQIPSLPLKDLRIKGFKARWKINLKLQRSFISWVRADKTAEHG